MPHIAPASDADVDPPPTDFDWITETIAVGGWVAEYDWPRLAREERIRAVVDLREEARNDPALLAAHGLDYLHLPTTDRGPVSAAMIERALAFLRSQAAAGRPTLIHCRHGIGRSAMVALCALVDRGDAPLDALERAKTARWKISPSPEQYEGWAAWLSAHRIAARRTWTVPDFDAFARIAYRHLASTDVDLR